MRWPIKSVPSSGSSRKMILTGLLTALALGIHALEAQVPLLFPGVKPGFANAISHFRELSPGGQPFRLRLQFCGRHGEPGNHHLSLWSYAPCPEPSGNKRYRRSYAQSGTNRSGGFSDAHGKGLFLSSGITPYGNPLGALRGHSRFHSLHSTSKAGIIRILQGIGKIKRRDIPERISRRYCLEFGDSENLYHHVPMCRHSVMRTWPEGEAPEEWPR